MVTKLPTKKMVLHSLMALTSIYFAVMAWKFVFIPASRNAFHITHFFETVPAATFAHFFFSALALFIGSFQFVNGIRTRVPNVHRAIGWMYVFSCLLAAASGLIMAINSKSGIWVTYGLSCLSVLWFITTLQALISAIQKDYKAHKNWMIRSFALTYFAVTDRVIFIMLIPSISGVDFMLSYTIGAWAAWILNLAVAEYFFCSHRPKQLYSN